MDDVIFSLWLKEMGLRVPARSAVPVDEPVLSPQPSAVADLDLVDPEDDGADDDGPSFSLYYPEHGGRWENTERVAAVFRLAGNPKYQDVRLRAAAKTNHYPDPTHRDVALEQAKRLSRSITW